MFWVKQVRRAVAVALAAFIAASSLTAFQLISESASNKVAAADLSKFDAGRIIDDSVFFNRSTMNAADIQTFLNSKVSNCRSGYTCLKDYTESTNTIGSNPMCAAYNGGTNESSANIIYKVAQACGINPQVLIVTLQKEQGLVTDTWPSTSQYRSAMGALCPDTAPCDSTASGFFKQVYTGAYLFKRYTQPAGTGSGTDYSTRFDLMYPVGQTSNILYNPNAGCGTKPVYVSNQATHVLYVYTPYTPNQAALAAGYSASSDGCGAYGNRNFYQYFVDYFGSPFDSVPIGNIDNMQPVPGGVGVWGWALDPDTSNSISLHVYVDGSFATGITANASRPDIANSYNLGAAHGFGFTVPTSGGSHRVCVYALNTNSSGANKALGCYTINVGGSPVGSIENAQAQPGGIGIWGNAIDLDTVEPVWIHIYMDGQMVKGVLADQFRANLPTPGYGNNHGFAAFLPAGSGQHRVCAYAINAGAGSNTSLGCFDKTLTDNPFGAVENATTGLNKINVYGYAIDPNITDPIDIHVYVDGTMAGGFSAATQRNNLGILAAYGTQHGFGVTVPSSNGTHHVCVYGINVGSGSNSLIGCLDVTVGGSPIGRVENAQPAFASIDIWGWTFDQDTAAPTYVHVYVDGIMKGGFIANQSRPDLAGTIPSDYGVTHGFGVNVPASPGTHQVCVFGINVGVGSSTQIGCFSATVNGDPVGAIENIQVLGSAPDRRIGVWGYALDPDTTEPIMVHAYMKAGPLNSTAAFTMVGGFGAGTYRSDLASQFPYNGGSHAFGYESIPLPSTSGTYTLCIYGINVGVGATKQMACQSFVVP